jgi:diguanylate cyclase (GGDEF)-like protein
VGDKQVAVVDASGRLIAELTPLAEAARVSLHAIRADASTAAYDAILVAPASAVDLPVQPHGSPPRWIVGDAGNGARLAGAARAAAAVGVLCKPVSRVALDAIAYLAPTLPDFDLARARGLIATSLVELTGSAANTLLAVAGGFGASDCIVWWNDGAQMVPAAARPSPTASYRTELAAAARIAAASAGTVITGGELPRSVIAEVLRSSATDVGGLIAIAADAARRFSVGERTDLGALAMRLARELGWLAGHRQLIADGERMLAASLHDPLTGAISRGAFERTVALEVAAAAGRQEPLALAVIDVLGLRRINLAHGHRAGDEVLAQIASRVRAAVRGGDPIGRLGGDELAVLLVNATAAHAEGVMNHLIAKIETEPIALDSTTDLPVQVRATLTALGVNERTGEAALARCYGALRAAPTGRARLVAADARAESPADLDTSGLSTGTIVGGTYRVVHELSRGARGVVYRGEDLGLGRPVAIKVLRPDLASDRELVARFRAEAGLLASLHHPNLVQVYALGEHAGDVYFVMELVEGQPLSEVLRATIDRGAWFPTAAAAQIALEIGDALDAMHAVGVIHRDVKPANILLDRERDRAVLVDVGVAVKAGDQRDAAGTPGFAAPESFLAHADAPTTDVYGLAATVYAMLTGKPPFGAGPAPQVVPRQLGDPLTPASRLRPGLSDAVDAVLAKALSPTPKKRWASAATFATALGRALDRLGAGEPAGAAVSDAARRRAELVHAPTEGHPAGLGGGPGVRAVTGHVRAAHLRVLSRLLHRHIGEAGLAQLAQDRPALAGVLASTLPPLAWVDLADLVAALSVMRTVLPNQAVPRTVGRGTMSATFRRLFGADPATLSAEAVLGALPAFWARYHDWGDAEATVGPGGADVVLHGYAGSVDVCALVAAELERVVELTGTATVAVVHDACAFTGARRCEYSLSWTR